VILVRINIQLRIKSESLMSTTPRLFLCGGLPDRIYDIKDIYCWFKIKVSGGGSSLQCVLAGDTQLTSVIKTCSESEISVIIYRVIANDTSKRAKIVMLRWTGSRANQKMRLESALLQKVSSLFKPSLVVDLDETSTENDFNKRFLDSCGAFKPSSFTWGTGSSETIFNEASPLLLVSSVSERPPSPTKIRTPKQTTDMLSLSVSELRIRTPPIDEDDINSAIIPTGAASPLIVLSPSDFSLAGGT
jgi:hypothetical protein